MKEYSKPLTEYEGLKIGDQVELINILSFDLCKMADNKAIITGIYEEHKNSDHDGFILDDTYVRFGLEFNERKGKKIIKSPYGFSLLNIHFQKIQ